MILPHIQFAALADFQAHLWWNSRSWWLSMLRPSWWSYLFAPKADPEYSWLEVVRCRAKVHPAGVIWHNPNGLEPDYTCLGCGDDLG